MSAHGKVWFVTGTSSGFGRCIALEAIARGERVVATARNPHALDDLVARAPDRVYALRLDVTEEGESRAPSRRRSGTSAPSTSSSTTPASAWSAPSRKPANRSFARR